MPSWIQTNGSFEIKWGASSMFSRPTFMRLLITTCYVLAYHLSFAGSLDNPSIPVAEVTRRFHPDAPYTTAEAFSKAIRSQAVMLDSTNVSILAPKGRQQAAAIVLPYLAKAYDEIGRASCRERV